MIQSEISEVKKYVFLLLSQIICWCLISVTLNHCKNGLMTCWVFYCCLTLISLESFQVIQFFFKDEDYDEKRKRKNSKSKRRRKKEEGKKKI